MELVLATRNPHKLREFEPLLAPHRVLPLPDDVELPPETGETFAENAAVKARTAAEATGMTAAPRTISRPSIAAARFSTFSCPYGCERSAGSSAFRTEKYATTEATRSIAECTASVMIATEPVSTPAATLSAIRPLFERIEKRAARALRWSAPAAVSAVIADRPRATRGTRGRHARGG